MCFQIGEQAQLFEHAAAEVLCLVDDQHGTPIVGMGGQQVLVEPIHQILQRGIPAGVVGRTQLVTDGGHELAHFQMRVPAQGNIEVGHVVFDQRADERGLARTHFADQGDKAAVLARAIQQVPERLAVAGTQVQERRIRGNRKRVVVKAVIAQIHA